MKRLLTLYYGFVSLLLSYPICAIVPPEYDSGRNALESEIEFGFIYSKSNTTTSTINSRLKFDYEIEAGEDNKDLDQTLTIRHYFSQDDSSITTQKFQIEYQLNYELGSKDSLFGRIEVEHDRFASFIDNQTISSGYSYNVYDYTKSKLKFEVGPGYRYSKPNTRISSEEALTSTNEPIIRGAVVWSKRFTQNLKVSSDAATELGPDNTISTLNSRLENHLLGNLSLTFEVRYKYTQVVPKNGKNSEFFSNLNLMYTF